MSTLELRGYLFCPHFIVTLPLYPLLGKMWISDVLFGKHLARINPIFPNWAIMFGHIIMIIDHSNTGQRSTIMCVQLLTKMWKVWTNNVPLG